MIWHPERQFALISLANITYAPMFDANFVALESLLYEGILPAPRVRSTGPLQKHAEALVALLNKWKDERAHEIFADNVVLDESFDRRKIEFEQISKSKGPFKCGEITAHNAASADVIMLDANGQHILKLSFKLSPQVPPLIQSYEVTVIAHADQFEI